MATHLSILAWRIPWTEEPGRLQSLGLQRVGNNLATKHNAAAAAAAKSLQSGRTFQPHRREPIRPSRPWDSEGKYNGVGCHFLLQCMKVKNESEVAQLCPTLRDPMNCSLPASSIHGICQARVLKWVATAFSKHNAKGEK